MIKPIGTDANKEDLSNIKETLDKVCPLNKYKEEAYWSKDGIRADQVYRVHRPTGRVVEETGVILQKQVIDMFDNFSKVFPYRMQLIKIDRNTFKTDIVIESQICQTITLLKNKCQTYILLNNSGEVTIPELIFGEYAIATYWTAFKDPSYPRWFIGKYLNHYQLKKHEEVSE